MRKILFSTNKVKAAILPGTKRAHALLAKHKKFSFGSAAILAMLIAPFAVQAMVPVFAEGDPTGNEPAQHMEEPMSRIESPAKDQQSKAEVKSSSEATDPDSSKTDVTINGQKVPVPKNGSVHKRMTNNSSETIVDVQVKNHSSSHSSSSSSTTIVVDNHSSTSGNNDEGSDIDAYDF